MGTFARYESSYSVPEHKRESLARQMSKLLGYGGMMQFEQVSMYGYEINILKPVEVAPFGRVHFHYNYFEDDGWETAGFDADRGVFWTGKIGSSEFHSVVVAVGVKKLLLVHVGDDIILSHNKSFLPS